MNDKQILILTKESISKLVEKLVHEFDFTYIDAILHLCEEVDIDYADIKKYLDEPILHKLKEEQENLHNLKISEDKRRVKSNLMDL